MPHSQKANLGHRGRAFAALKPRLRDLLNQVNQVKQ
jgi:inosine/xanthosine triphosphate pyrophosphatase family protein